MRFIIAVILIKIICLFKNSQCTRHIYSTRPTKSDLLNAASDIISSNFAWKTEAINFIMALNNETKYEWNFLINDFIVRNSGSAVVYVEYADFIRKRRRFNNILIVDSYKSFRNIYGKISTDTFVIDGFYLVICINRFSLMDIEEIFRFMWNIFIYNIDFLMDDEDDKGKINLVTFMPFTKCDNDTCRYRQKDECGNVRPVIINQYVNGSFQLNRQHFPEKITNLHQCPVKIVTFNCPPMMMINYYDSSDGEKLYKLVGADGEMITTLADELNFKIDLFHISDTIRWGSLSSNGTSSGAMKMIIENQADLTVGMYTITFLRRKYMTSSEFYYSVPFILIVPPGSPLSSFEKLFRPFQLSVWILLLLTFIIAFIVIIIIKLQRNSIRAFVFGRRNRSPFLNVLIAFVGGSQTQLPQRNFARTLLMIYLLFCLVKRSLYQGALFQFLQIDDRHSEVQSIEDLVENEFEVYMFPSSLEHTQNMKFRDKRRTVNASVLAEKRMETLNPSAKHAVSSSLEQVLYYNKLNYRDNTLTVCKEYLFTFQYGIYFRKNSYLAEKFNKKISLFKTSGLIDFWASDYISSKYLNIKIESDGPRMLNIGQLLGGFEVLFIGIIIATIVFICEVIALKFRISCMERFFKFFA